MGLKCPTTINELNMLLKHYNYREMVKLVNQCHPVKLQMEDAIPWQFVFLMELEEWFNVSAAPDLQVGKKSN